MCGKTEPGSVEEKKERHLQRLSEEFEWVLHSSVNEYREKFIDPPKTRAYVLPYQGVDIREAEFETAQHDDKLVLLDLMVWDGKTHLVARNANGDIVGLLLTWDGHGLSLRHRDIDPNLGLALSTDGSLKGRLAEPSESKIGKEVPGPY